MESLIQCMEETRRAILRFQPKLGWSCTNAEGAEDNQLLWHLTEIEAIDAMTGKRSTITVHEAGVTSAVRASGEAWVCEWSCGHWIRPFSLQHEAAAQVPA